MNVLNNVLVDASERDSIENILGITRIKLYNYIITKYLLPTLMNKPQDIWVLWDREMYGHEIICVGKKVLGHQQEQF